MASNLKEAARQLTEEIGEWESDAEAAGKRIQALHDALEEREKALDEAIADLEEEVAEFVSKIAQETATLAGSLNDAHQAMTRVERSAEGAQKSAGEAVAQGEEVVRDLTERLTELTGEVEEIVLQSVETPAGQLADQSRALAEAIETAFAGTAGNMDSLAAGVGELQEAIPTAADGLNAAIKKTSEHVGGAFVEWTSHLFEVVDLVDKKAYDAITDNTGEVVAHALEQAREQLDEAADRAVAGVAELEGKLDAIGDALAEVAKEDVGDGLREPVAAELADLSSAIEESVKWLKEVRSWLGEYKFV